LDYTNERLDPTFCGYIGDNEVYQLSDRDLKDPNLMEKLKSGNYEYYNDLSKLMLHYNINIYSGNVPVKYVLGSSIHNELDLFLTNDFPLIVEKIESTVQNVPTTMKDITITFDGVSRKLENT
jgi:hypothetical protein